MALSRKIYNYQEPIKRHQERQVLNTLANVQNVINVKAMWKCGKMTIIEV